MKIGKLAISIALCLSAGFIGSLFTQASVNTWYQGLSKPWFNPPSYVFGPVWTVLYILMGVSFYLVWMKKSKVSIVLFAIQLALNVLWSALFFGLRSLFLSSIEIVILWSMIMFMMIYFYKVSRTAAYLLIPYILWVSFALVLNLSILFLN